MSVSDKIGTFEVLSVWNLSPIAAFFVAWGVQFVSVNLAIAVEGDFGRGRYLNFLTNNGFLLPLNVAMVTVVLQEASPSHAWYTQTWWQVACLVGPLVAWIAIDHPNYEAAALVSPSKLTHTVASVFVGYWLIAPLPAFFATFQPVWAAVIAVLAVVGAVWFWVGRGDSIVYPTGNRTAPHVRWSWKYLRQTGA